MVPEPWWYSGDQQVCRIAGERNQDKAGGEGADGEERGCQQGLESAKQEIIPALVRRTPRGDPWLHHSDRGQVTPPPGGM